MKFSGSLNFVNMIQFKKTGGLDAGKLSTVCDYIVWYSKDREHIKYRQLFIDRKDTPGGLTPFRYYFDADHRVRTAKLDDSGRPIDLPVGVELFQTMALTSQAATPTSEKSFRFDGQDYRLPPNKHWRFSVEGLDSLAKLGRIIAVGDNVRAVSYLRDFPVAYLNNNWTDTGAGSFLESQLYVVQTVTKVISRCMLMATDPGDLVFDPTCGSGTTAHVAEQWGRRWMTCDTSRVAISLAKQRLTTAPFEYYELAHPNEGVKQRVELRKGISRYIKVAGLQ